jgi:hypothetical protein
MAGKDQISKSIKIDYSVFKYVLGRDRENLISLQSKYPTLDIYVSNNTKHCINVVGSLLNQVELCVKDINKYVMDAYSYNESRAMKKKINKEKNDKRRSIQAVNTIKENIKKELEKQALVQTTNTKQVPNELKKDDNDISNGLKNNPYYYLLEDSE